LKVAANYHGETYTVCFFNSQLWRIKLGRAKLIEHLLCFAKTCVCIRCQNSQSYCGGTYSKISLQVRNVGPHEVKAKYYNRMDVPSLLNDFRLYTVTCTFHYPTLNMKVKAPFV